MKEMRPDVIYSFMPVSNVLCAMSVPKFLRRRCVWGIRAAGFAAGSRGLHLMGRIALYLERFLSRVPARIISNSESAVREHARVGFRRESFRVSENVIDTGTFRYDDAIRQCRRESMGVGPTIKVVVNVSRLDPIKGYETFVDAAIAVLNVRQDVQFWSIGGGDQDVRSTLASRIAARGFETHFRWLGEVCASTEVAELLMASDLGVSASWSEGFPNSIAEYAACGLRVVATDVGDSTRIIGANGACVPAGDAAAMSRQILEELDREPARDHVRADFLVRFDPGILMDRHEAILKEVATVA
jgi:glycosyltransferase involved in cell wall biosynthesis